MEEIKNLIPFTKNHSLSEAIFTIFLAEPIIKPEKFEELILTGNFKNTFHEFKRGIKHDLNFTFSEKNTTYQLNNSEITGFTFEKFELDKLEWAIIGQNEPYPHIAIHCLNYIRWANFIESTIPLLKTLGSFDSKGLKVKAFGLNNIDQFNWVGTKFPRIKRIFNENSEYLPKKFFEAQGDFNFTLNQNISTSSDKTSLKYVERLDVFAKSIAEGNINLGIIHNVIRELDELTDLLELIEDNNMFLQPINWAHQQNKTVLKELLTEPVKNLIKLF